MLNDFVTGAQYGADQEAALDYLKIRYGAEITTSAAIFATNEATATA